MVGVSAATRVPQFDLPSYSTRKNIFDVISVGEEYSLRMTKNSL
jgi:hypothetical protein